MQTLANIMNGHKTAEIVCAYKGTVVRRLTVDGEVITVDALTEKVDVLLTTPVTYEAWMFDRGSMLFSYAGKVGKLCTEGDIIRFADGSEGHVYPDNVYEHEDEGTSDAGERCY